MTFQDNFHQPRGRPLPPDRTSACLEAPASSATRRSTRVAESDGRARLGWGRSRDLSLLHAAAAAWPDRADLLHAQARAWEALDDKAAGIDAFARAVAARPQDVELATAFGRHLVRGGHLAILEELVEVRFLADPDPAVQARGLWLLARARLDRAATTAALASVQRMLTLQSDRAPGHPRLAQVHRAEGHHARALDLLDRLAADLPEDTAAAWHWDRIELGTRPGRWASVRDSAARLGMPVQPRDAPIDERWSACRVDRPWVEGRGEGRGEGGMKERIQPAIRTDPETARLVGLAPPGSRQRYGDVVLVRAEAIPDGAPGLPDPSDGPLLQTIEVLHPGGYTVRALDGRHPDEQPLRGFGERLQAHGVVVQRWEPEHPGGSVHLRLGLRAGRSQEAVEDLVEELRRAVS